MSNPSYSEVLEFVQQNSCPFVTSQDVAEEFPEVSGRTIRKRLNELVKRGDLNRRRVGAHAKVWYLPDQRNASASNCSPSSVSQ
jgi:DeoR/GlpR family transcriptional regulator of sugar metabolism